ncbi:MAG: DNA repair protein RecO (recombination protein O) [Halieaceae bacterium]|jgi:DNA repair protein RecO (recombination protein O)
MPQQLQPAYLLHRRPFRDNSHILEVFCLQAGRAALVMRGASRRRPGGSLSAVLQPFRPLLLSFTGRSELQTLTGAETAGDLAVLGGDALLSAFYLNELLLRLLHKHEAHPQLFAVYGSALGRLADGDPIEPVLREFEFSLLQDLGYAVDMRHEESSGSPLDPQGRYRLAADMGFELVPALAETPGDGYLGCDLLAIAEGSYGNELAPVAKRLMRELLAPHLGSAPLRSRMMFAGRARSAGQA